MIRRVRTCNLFVAVGVCVVAAWTYVLYSSFFRTVKNKKQNYRTVVQRGEQRRHGIVERQNGRMVYTIRMTLTLCGERIDEIYYIFYVFLKLMYFGKGGGCSLFLFFFILLCEM